MVRLVLFDIDGTLIHTDGAGVRAFARAFEMQFNIGNSVEGMKFSGRTDTGLAREMFCKHRIDPSPENLSFFFELYTFWLAHLLNECKGDIFPGGMAVHSRTENASRTACDRAPDRQHPPWRGNQIAPLPSLGVF